MSAAVCECATVKNNRCRITGFAERVDSIVFCILITSHGSTAGIIKGTTGKCAGSTHAVYITDSVGTGTFAEQEGAAVKLSIARCICCEVRSNFSLNGTVVENQIRTDVFTANI